MEDYKFLFKVVLVGNAGVGKTCLVRRFTQGLFPPGQGATIGVDFMIKTVEIENEKVKEPKWKHCFVSLKQHQAAPGMLRKGSNQKVDEYAKKLLSCLAKKAQEIHIRGFTYIYGDQLQIWDTAGQERFRSITHSYYRSAHALILVYDISCQPTFDCLPDWLKEIEEYASSKVLRVLVGNKIDRDDREIPTHVGEDFAQRHNMYYLETSAKESDNVEKLFVQIAAELMEQAKSKELPRYDEINSQNINRRTTSIDVTCCGN